MKVLLELISNVASTTLTKNIHLRISVCDLVCNNIMYAFNQQHHPYHICHEIIFCIPSFPKNENY